jgi:protein-S-isoprenylcysteine O-methyltransferase Ste14
MNKEKVHKRKSYEKRVDLAGENVWGDLGQLILFIVFIVGIILDLVFLRIGQSFVESVPLFLRIIVALPVLIISGYLAQSGLKIVFREERSKLVVIRTGVFSLVRHPIYLGSMLLYLGFIILSMSVIAFGIWIIIIVFYVYISRYEENILIDKLGEKYEQYMRDVSMFIPKIRR